MNILDRKAILYPHNPKPADRSRAHLLADRLEEFGLDREAGVLRCCKKYFAEIDGKWLYSIGCNRKFCPICRASKQSKKYWTLRPKIAELLALGGACSLATLTLPHSPDDLSTRMTRVQEGVSALFRRQAWKGPEGFRTVVGLVIGFELADGSAQDGHPHAHILIVGSSDEMVRAASEWLVQTWVASMPGAHHLAQGVEFVGCEPEAWEPALRYVVKGTPVQPGWPDHLILDLLKALSTGRHSVVTSGLLRTRRNRKKVPAGGAGMPEVCLSPGNYREATSCTGR